MKLEFEPGKSDSTVSSLSDSVNKKDLFSHEIVSRQGSVPALIGLAAKHNAGLRLFLSS